MSVNKPKVLIPAVRISERVRQLGARITSDFRSARAASADCPNAREDHAADDAEQPLILLGVLKGALYFLADLSREVSVPAEIEYISVASYGKSTKSSGVVRILKDLDRDIAGADVLLVEDIVDTGLTLEYLLRILATRRPRSLKVCSLLDKPARRVVDVPLDYVGFTVPDEFVVGYGLDYDQRYRNLPYIASLRNLETSGQQDRTTPPKRTGP
ncbi:MAG: hypoxanthine phosphoribosyltransferase [Gemmatimonadota bacterium]|nr:hypoxanthine phosphoribosyltransferase [Gemmatimonadota bacterium]